MRWVRSIMLTACAIGTVLAHAAPILAQPAGTSSAAEALDRSYLELQRLDDTEEIIVTGTRPTTAGSASIVRARDLLLRPRRRPADLLEVIPGLEVVQHAGGGKANQYFIRGFDADHGTDLALSVDGVPVNMVSHGHGQGYADLHFVIPELVDRIEVKKGPYFAELGDFATAGAVDMILREDVRANSLSLSGGSFDTYRGLAIGGGDLGPVGMLFAGELYATNGPFVEGESLRRYNLLGRGEVPVLGGDLMLTLDAYGARWNASGQIPNREVAAGRLDRFGTVDATEGGSSRRMGGSVRWRRSSGHDDLSLMAYVTQSHLDLFSDFTFFSRDPVNGDEIEQTDDRIVAGADARYRFDTKLGPIDLTSRFGLQTRTDLIDNGLFHDRARARLEPVVSAHVRETSLAAYAEEELHLTEWLRAQLGLRGDYFHFAVDGSGSKHAFAASPKGSLIVTPLDDTDVFVNFGLGFHSNDARGVLAPEDPVTPLTRAIGGELGARTRLFDRLDLAATVFLIDLASEIVWVGDEGTTEANGPTRRLGVETEARLQLLRWLWADADFTFARAHFTGAAPGAREIPLAPRLTVSGGLSAIHPIGIFGRIGVQHVGDRPATEDGFLTAVGYTKADLTLGYRTHMFEISVDLENLLNADIREAQFATVSRLPSETSAASCPDGTRAVSDGGAFLGCEDLHFTPGPPLSARLTASLFF